MASMSKREQARNEGALQELLRQPGNSTCADCGARNPAWASWNLGIFLCMRCASLHRKLGTHISKVKSLSMDKWTTEQVDNMKERGNIVSNKHYNPKNKKPDIPLDADEVDSAMERYIRKKYQEKSLVDGRPEPPSRADVSPSLTQSPQASPNPELPPTGKKHKFFGFSLRTSSKKDRPGVQEAFKVTPVEYSPTSGRVREVPELELQQKLAQLRDMGFRENDRNLEILKRQGGDLERTIATLVKLGPAIPSRGQSASPAPQSQSPATASAPQSATMSNNPFDNIQRPQPQSEQSSGFGLSFGSSQQHSQPVAAPSANPWQAAMPAQVSQPTGLEQQFSTMQVSNPLFPHHTGGYASQPSYQNMRSNTMTPPVPAVPQQYGYPSSPASNGSNPFYQQPLSSQSTGNNPFLQHQQSQPVFAPQTQNNPFFTATQPQPQQSVPSSTNPFGLAPVQQLSQLPNQQPVQSPVAQQQSTNPFGLPPQASPPPIQQSQTFPINQSSAYIQGQTAQGTPFSQQPVSNIGYGQPQPHSQQAYYQNQQYSQQAPAPLQAQATGRYTKTDILALFNSPSSNFQQQQPLAPVQEASDPSAVQTQPQQQLSPVPSNNPYGATPASPARRSATMPVMSTMHSSGGPGTASRNPFGAPAQIVAQQQTPSPFGQTQPWTQTQGYRHASNESVSVNNPALIDGRHSPDAFASLSARY